MSQFFIGKEGFVWWQGVVEDRHDPLKLGRCRVRIAGWHTKDKTKIDTTQLPWAYPVQPITSASMGGIGTTPLGPVEGTWVVGFFRDGQSAQEPVIFGTIGGYPEKSGADRVGEGFEDPRTDFSRVIDGKNADGSDNTDHLHPRAKFTYRGADATTQLGTKRKITTYGVTTADSQLSSESTRGDNDTNRLARAEITKPHSIKQLKTDGLDKGVPIANGKDGSTWDEPANPNASVYPFNHVRETESGHIQEFDDTPSAERIHTYHKTGTFDEIHPDGSHVEKIVGDDYNIVAKGKNVHIKGTCNVYVETNCNLYVKGNLDQQIDGNWNIVCKGEKTETITGNHTTTSSANVKIVGARIDLNP